MALKAPPDQLETIKHFYIFKTQLNVDPLKHREFCQKFQKKWDEELSKDKTLMDKMIHFKKNSSLTFVWVADKLEGRLPDDVNQKETYRLLLELYDTPQASTSCDDAGSDSLTVSTSADADKGRTTQYQITQHFLALKRILQAAEKREDLSEELVKSAHGDLMKGLKTDQGEIITAGQYRLGPCSAGSYSFPDYSCIRESMKGIIAKYNSKMKSEGHDMFEVASWLLYQIVTLHPFQDGNGRICRLLWCYSLVRDGLPFPLTISARHRKAHDIYAKCIIEDRQKNRSGYPCLTALTVVSIKEKWENFISNLQFEYPEGYDKITQWLEREKLDDF